MLMEDTNIQEFTMKVKDYFVRLISRVTGKDRNIDAMFSQGDWRFIQLSNYTSASPFSVLQGNTSKLTFQQSDISYTAGRDLNINYDYTLQKWMPQTLNDVLLAEVRMKCKCSAQNGHFDILLESPTFGFNPIQSVTHGVPKAANQEQFVSISVPIFIGPDVLANGLEVKVSAVSGNLSVYDVSYMMVRLTSGIT